MTKKPAYNELARKVKELEQEVAKRKFAEEAVRESEERYFVLAEHVADGVSLIQNGKILYANAAFISLYGYTESSQLIGKDAVDLVCSEFKEPFFQIYNALIAGASREKHFQAKCVTRDGRELWVEERYNIIQWKSKPAVLATARDITKIKRLEITIKEEAERLRRENIKLMSTLKDRYRFGNIVGKSHAIQEIYNSILEASASDAGVVIYGESGTGKELIAKTIHDMSDRHENSFVPVNCGAIPESIFENEFFGHLKGSFTGAHSDNQGFFDRAHKGTLFLDEAGELNLNMQVKLLRAIEGRGFTPIGGNKVKYADVRIIAATNVNLKDQMRLGKIREDFFYRIHIIPIYVPALRDRKEDIPLLAEHFLKIYTKGKKPREIPSNIMETLCNYTWPGNVRELQNVLQRYIAVKHFDLMAESSSLKDGNNNLPFDSMELSGNPAEEQRDEILNLRFAVKDYEKNLIVKALDQTHWNRNKASKLLDIPLRTLSGKIKHFKLI